MSETCACVGRYDDLPCVTFDPWTLTFHADVFFVVAGASGGDTGDGSNASRGDVAWTALQWEFGVVRLTFSSSLSTYKYQKYDSVTIPRVHISLPVSEKTPTPQRILLKFLDVRTISSPETSFSKPTNLVGFGDKNSGESGLAFIYIKH